MTAAGRLVRSVGVGGESSGWAIRLDTKATIEGKPTKLIEVSGAREDLRKLENKHVTAVGSIIIRHGVERGEWPVLRISAITESKP